MCNRYRAASVTSIRDMFGFTYIEEPQPLYATTGIGPLQPGPFVRPGKLVVGQWGLTPDDSATLRPMNKRTGKPLSTNNARFDVARGMPEAWTFKGAWSRGQRCIIPAQDFDEPYWGTGKNIWWRFARADGKPWAIAGLWNEWTNPATGEVFPSYTMLTINCNAHPLLSLMHKPDRDPETNEVLPPEKQDKRTVVTLESKDWDRWLSGSKAEAAALMCMPDMCVFKHGAADPAQQLELPILNK